MASAPPQAVLKVGHIAEQLRTMILSGDLAPGTPLRQTSISRQLGVSIIPFREAIRCLEQEGLVVSRPFKGAEVARLCPDELLAFAWTRIAMETEALSLAMANHTPETLAAAREALGKVQALEDPLQRFEGIYRFLEALYRPGLHAFLLDEILRLVSQGQRYASLAGPILRALPDDLPRYEDILDAMGRGDVEQARADLRLLYLHTAILGVALLYERDLNAPVLQRRPRGRPRKLPLEDGPSLAELDLAPCYP